MRCPRGKSAAKRAAIRESWGAQLRSLGCVDLMFVLAQPPPSQAQQAAAMLRQELAEAVVASLEAPDGGDGRVDGGGSPLPGGSDLAFVPGWVRQQVMSHLASDA